MLGARRRVVVLVSAALLLAGCAAPDGDGLPTRRPTEAPVTVSATRTVRPSLTPEARTPVCPGTPLNRLIVQERARVVAGDENLNLRAGPGIDNRRLDVIAPGDVVFVLDGPRCVGGYTWYRVNYAGQVGWVAEGDPSDYYIEPYMPG